MRTISTQLFILLFTGMLSSIGAAQSTPAHTPSGNAKPSAAKVVKRASATSPTLEDTYWHLMAVGDTAVTAAVGPREPHILLSSRMGRLSGAGGCNGLTGRYEITGDQLLFHQVAATMMACKVGMDTEKAFLAALNKVKSWKITGKQLELFDEEGHSLAKLEARLRK